MEHPNPSTALGRVVVDELARNGVDRLVLAPGSRSTPVALAAVDHPGLEVHVEIDERSAAFLALGIGKARSRPAAVLTTSGTAAANLHPAVVEADSSRTPLLLLTANRPPELRERGANQTIDQYRLFGRAVRWFAELAAAEDLPVSNPYWRSAICRAVAASRGWTGTPGPVHLDLGFREPLVPLSDDGRSSAPSFTSPTDGRPEGEPWTHVSLPTQSRPPPLPPGRWERPLVVLGDGAGPAEVPPGVPVIAEGVSSGRLPGTISTAHHLLGHPGFTRRHRPDLVVTIGRVGLSPNLPPLLRSARFHLAVDPGVWTDPFHTASGIAPLVDLAGLDPEPAWGESWEQADAAARGVIDEVLDALEPVTEPRVARDAARALPPDGILVAASSMPVRDLDWFMPPIARRVLGNRGASGIDGFVSTALGVAIGGGSPVVALAGDLSVLHDANGLLLADRPDCVFVVVNNDGGGIFSFLPQARLPESFERLFGTPHGRDLALLAAFHEVGHRRVERPAHLVPAVEEALAGGGVWMVEVITDRNENVSVHRRLSEAVHRRLDEILQEREPA